MTFIKTAERATHTTLPTGRPEAKCLAQKTIGLFTEVFLLCLCAGLQKLKARWEGGQSGSPTSGLRPGSDVGIRLFPCPLPSAEGSATCLLSPIFSFSLSSRSLLFLSDFFSWPSCETKIYLTSSFYPKGLIFFMFNVFSFLFNCDILKLQNSYFWISFHSVCLILMVATKNEICF